jgi:hypothetical protein
MNIRFGPLQDVAAALGESRQETRKTDTHPE